MTVRQRFLNPLVLAFIIRLIIMPLFYHPDIKSQHYHFQFLSQGYLNIYQFIDQNLPRLAYTDTFNYLPLTYFFFGAIQFLLRPFLPHDFFLWLNDWGVGANDYPNLYCFMFILKIPYLFFDFLTAFLILRLTNSPKAFRLWLFNPISLYVIYVLGNFDIVPVFFTCLSLYLVKKQRYSFSALSLGIAISLKAYPVLFLPFIILRPPYRLRLIFSYIFLATLPLLATIIPFLFGHHFLQSFTGSGLTQKIMEYRFLQLPLFPVLYFFILIHYLLTRPSSQYFHLSLVFLIFLSLVNFHPQWLIWFLPFQLVYIFTKPSLVYLHLPLYFLVFTYIFLTPDSFLFWGHLTAVDSQFINLTSPHSLLFYRFSLNPDLIRDLSHRAITLYSIFLASAYVQNRRRLP